MAPILSSWLQFLLCAALIGVAGTALSRYGDVIADKTGLGGTCLDFLRRGESVYTRASRGHILSAGFGVILIGFVGFNVLLAGSAFDVALSHVGLYTPLIIVLYAVAMRTMFRYEHAQMRAYTEERAERYPEISPRQAVQRYVLAALGHGGRRHIDAGAGGDGGGHAPGRHRHGDQQPVRHPDRRGG
jgi:cation:H+ antiporter